MNLSNNVSDIYLEGRGLNDSNWNIIRVKNGKLENAVEKVYYQGGGHRGLRGRKNFIDSNVLKF